MLVIFRLMPSSFLPQHPLPFIIFFPLLRNIKLELQLLSYNYHISFQLWLAFKYTHANQQLICACVEWAGAGEESCLTSDRRNEISATLCRSLSMETWQGLFLGCFQPEVVGKADKNGFICQVMWIHPFFA